MTCFSLGESGSFAASRFKVHSTYLLVRRSSFAVRTPSFRHRSCRLPNDPAKVRYVASRVHNEFPECSSTSTECQDHKIAQTLFRLSVTRHLGNERTTSELTSCTTGHHDRKFECTGIVIMLNDRIIIY